LFGREQRLNNVWVEIKPTPELDDRERQKLAQFAKETGYNLLLIAGDPGPEAILRLISFNESDKWLAPHVNWTYAASAGLGLVYAADMKRQEEGVVRQALQQLTETPVLNAAVHKARRERFEASSKRCKGCGKRFEPVQRYHALCYSCYREQYDETPTTPIRSSAADPGTDHRLWRRLTMLFAGGGLLVVIAVAAVLVASPDGLSIAAPTAETVPTQTPSPVPSRTAMATVEAAATTAPAVCDCSSNAYNCANFGTQEESQACFDFCFQEAGDVHFLDEDGDMTACEGLP